MKGAYLSVAASLPARAWLPAVAREQPAATARPPTTSPTSSPTRAPRWNPRHSGTTNCVAAARAAIATTSS